jgi:hypothetical protein
VGHEYRSQRAFINSVAGDIIVSSATAAAPAGFVHAETRHSVTISFQGFYVLLRRMPGAWVSKPSWPKAKAVTRLHQEGTRKVKSLKASREGKIIYSSLTFSAGK